MTPKTLGADTGYDAGDFLLAVEQRTTVPHVSIREGPIKPSDAPADARRRSRRRSTESEAHRRSQRKRKRVEQVIGWVKTVGGLARTRFLGRPREGRFTKRQQFFSGLLEPIPKPL